MSLEDITKFMNDYWRWFKGLLSRKNNSDAFYTEIAETGGKLSQKYGDTKYCRDIVVAGMEELYRKVKEA